MDGNRMVATQYDLSFRVDRDRSLLCKKAFKQEELKEFQKARGRAGSGARCGQALRVDVAGRLNMRAGVQGSAAAAAPLLHPAGCVCCSPVHRATE